MPLRFEMRPVALPLTSPLPIFRMGRNAHRARVPNFANRVVALYPACVTRRRACRNRSGGGRHLIRCGEWRSLQKVLSTVPWCRRKSFHQQANHAKGDWQYRSLIWSPPLQAWSRLVGGQHRPSRRFLLPGVGRLANACKHDNPKVSLNYIWIETIPRQTGPPNAVFILSENQISNPAYI